MVDQFDEHGPDESHPGPNPGGELPPDLFDDPGHPGGTPPGAAEPAGIAPPPARPYANIAEYPPAPPAPKEGPAHPIFPVALGGVMLAALAVACFTNLEAPQPAPASGAAPAPAPVAAPPSPEEVVAEEIKGLKAQVDGFAAQVKDLQGKIEAMPKAASQEDLEGLQAKVADLSKTPKADDDLPKKVNDLDGRVKSLDKTLAGLRDDVGALKGDVKKIGETAMAAPAPAQAAGPARTDDADKPSDVNVEDQAMSQGADLYAAGKYKEAVDVFRKAADAASNDARVWYYAALSNGMATNQWTGETVRLVTKGMEREKAGTPEAGKIDQLFAKLPAKQKVWLDYYRKLAK